MADEVACFKSLKAVGRSMGISPRVVRGASNGVSWFSPSVASLVDEALDGDSGGRMRQSTENYEAFGGDFTAFGGDFWGIMRQWAEKNPCNPARSLPNPAANL